MPKTDLVPCFYKEQDSSWESPAKMVLREEARQMKAVKAGVFIDHGRAFRLAASAPATLRNFRASRYPTKTSDFESDTAISFAEMLANVGIVEDTVRNPAEVIALAKAKIKAYRSQALVDEKSPLASGSWYRATQIEVVAVQ